MIERHKTIIVVDHSDRDGFQFGFVCGLCGCEWESDYTPFDPKCIVGNLDETDRDLLWREDLRKSLETAKEDAAIEFNRCPECGTWVCDGCFYISDTDCTDICNICIESIK